MLLTERDRAEFDRRPAVAGVHGYRDRFNQAWESIGFEGLSHSRGSAVTSAYDDYIDEVFAATGVEIDNPIPPVSASGPGEGQRIAQFHERVAELTAKTPGFAARDHKAIMQGVAERAAKLRADLAGGEDIGFGGLGSVLGSISATLMDPLVLLTAPIGGEMIVGQAAGRTLLGTIGRHMAAEAFVAAAVEGALQIPISGFKAEIGSPYGWGDALSSVAFAGAGGAVIGGLAGVLARYRGARAAGRIKETEDLRIAETLVEDAVEEARLRNELGVSPEAHEARLREAYRNLIGELEPREFDARMRSSTSLGSGVVAMREVERDIMAVPVLNKSRSLQVFSKQGKAASAAEAAARETGVAVHVAPLSDGKFTIVPEAAVSLVRDGDDIAAFATEAEARKASGALKRRQKIKGKLEPVPIDRGAGTEYALAKNAAPDDLAAARSSSRGAPVSQQTVTEPTYLAPGVPTADDVLRPLREALDQALSPSLAERATVARGGMRGGDGGVQATRRAAPAAEASSVTDPVATPERHPVIARETMERAEATAPEAEDALVAEAERLVAAARDAGREIDLPTVRNADTGEMERAAASELLEMADRDVDAMTGLAVCAGR